MELLYQFTNTNQQVEGDKLSHHNPNQIANTQTCNYIMCIEITKMFFYKMHSFYLKHWAQKMAS